MYCSSHIYFASCCLLISGAYFVRSDCIGRSAVFCDSIADLKYEPLDKTDWEEIIIGNQNQIPQRTLKKDTLSLANAKEVRIINQFNASEHVVFIPNAVTKLVLYGNELNAIFLIYNMSSLVRELDLISLHHNDIKMIDLVHCISSPISLLFKSPTAYSVLFKVFVKKIDLSYNKLNCTESANTLCPKLSADELILSHNVLWSIRPNSLPTGLRHLYLDHNKFVYFSNINLNSHNLSRLEFLTLAHNELKTVDDLPVLESLERLDLSFNNIYHIPEVFGRFKNLKSLNLEWNHLIRFTFPQREAITRESIDVNLAFNRLRNLDVRSVKDYTANLWLYGNPWNCKCIDNLVTELMKRSGQSLNISCFPDHIPRCVVNVFYGEMCSDQQIDEKTFYFFRNITNRVMNWPTHKCQPFVYD